MNIGFSKSLEISLGGGKMLNIYVQKLNRHHVQINIYYFTGKPYSSAVDSKTEKFAIVISFIP